MLSNAVLCRRHDRRQVEAYSPGSRAPGARSTSTTIPILGGIHWLDTTWKAEQEAAKKAGYIQSYEVLLANPQGPNDPDILLVITYKNWAALDGGLAKGDEIAKQVEGSVAKANQSEADRSKMRRVLGSQTMQVANLK